MTKNDLQPIDYQARDKNTCFHDSFILFLSWLNVLSNNWLRPFMTEMTKMTLPLLYMCVYRHSISKYLYKY